MLKYKQGSSLLHQSAPLTFLPLSSFLFTFSSFNLNSLPLSFVSFLFFFLPFLFSFFFFPFIFTLIFIPDLSPPQFHLDLFPLYPLITLPPVRPFPPNPFMLRHHLQSFYFTH